MPITSGPLPPRDMNPLGWGDPVRRRAGLPPHVRRWLAKQAGIGDRHTPPVNLDSIQVSDCELDDSVLDALANAVGDSNVLVDRATRLSHGSGKSYLDLARSRRGEVQLPDAVLTPPDAAAVLSVLRVCTEHGIAVVPFGGGTSVVGGLTPLRGPHSGIISLDLRRLSELVRVDPESLTATVGPGLRGPEVERLLSPHGLTLGHVPQSWEYATLGGYAATRSAGQASSGYGRFDDLVLGIRLTTPAGILVLGRAPASAAGPDLRAIVLGSEGVFGVITELTLRVRHIPEVTYDEGWSFRTFDAGLDALRRLAQSGLSPEIARLSDAEESRVNLAFTGGNKARLLKGLLAARGHRDGCLLVVGWEGTRSVVRDRRTAAATVLRAAGGLRLGVAIGEAWRRHRYTGPYLRDDLLDLGAMVETLETATSWSDVAGLYHAVRSALVTELRRGGARPLVMGHVSHIYPTGASLYFTAMVSQDPSDPDGQWHRAKERATEVIMAAKGTLTHHHAVGIDHRPWLREEIGDLGVQALRALKQVFDPAGILNPGKLIPEENDK